MEVVILSIPRMCMALSTRYVLRGPRWLASLCILRAKMLGVLGRSQVGPSAFSQLPPRGEAGLSPATLGKR